jgi:hypothetical protein
VPSGLTEVGRHDGARPKCGLLKSRNQGDPSVPVKGRHLKRRENLLRLTSWGGATDRILRRREKGQFLVLGAVLLSAVLLIGGALLIDQRILGSDRRLRENASEEACMKAAVALNLGQSWTQAITDLLGKEGYDYQFYAPQQGAGATLVKGYELGSRVISGIPVPTIRVALRGPGFTFFHQLIGHPGDCYTGDWTLCTSGVGGIYPILIKQYETTPGWKWGDTVVMFGNGRRPNNGPNNSATGIGNPDIYCVDAPADQCAIRWYRDPPAPTGAQVDTLKSEVEGYLTIGYDGPLTPVGTYIPRQSGVSNNQAVRAFMTSHSDGSYVAVFVIKDGNTYFGVNGFDFVDIMGYAIFHVDWHDANTVWGHPVTPILTDSNQLYQYPIDPIVLTWK